MIFSYVLEHYFDDNGVKDSAPEELKAEFKDVNSNVIPKMVAFNHVRQK